MQVNKFAGLAQSIEELTKIFVQLDVSEFQHGQSLLAPLRGDNLIIGANLIPPGCCGISRRDRPGAVRPIALAAARNPNAPETRRKVPYAWQYHESARTAPARRSF